MNPINLSRRHRRPIHRPPGPIAALLLISMVMTAPAPAAPPTGEARQRTLETAATKAEQKADYENAERLYRRLLENDRLHGPAIEGLRRVTKSRPLPVGSRALEDARRRLPARFLQYETGRFVVLSDTDPSWARAQAQRLERTHHQFQRFVRRLDLEALPLRHKLVCVLFDRRDEYQHFATQHDEVDDPWIAGYYTPDADRVVFYRGDSNPSVVDARAKLDAMSDDIDAIRQDVREAQHAGAARYADELNRHRREYEAHVRAEQQRVQAFARQIGIATVVHEAVHQLMFHTGLQSSRAPSPLWLSEGLATTFETDGTKGAFGPDHEYAPRREAFIELLQNDALLELPQMIRWDEMPDDGGETTVHQLYHQSYALVAWMYRYRRGQLAEFMESLLVEPGPEISPERHQELFEAAFGHVDRLERKWLRFEREQVNRTVRVAP